jgi:thioredoxin-like negative regulator of GroEL
MAMFIGRLVAEHDNLIKVDIARDVALAHAFGVIITPTLILVRNGMVEQVLVGGRSEKKVRALLG